MARRSFGHGEDFGSPRARIGFHLRERRDHRGRLRGSGSGFNQNQQFSASSACSAARRELSSPPRHEDTKGTEVYEPVGTSVLLYFVSLVSSW